MHWELRSCQEENELQTLEATVVGPLELSQNGSIVEGFMARMERVEASLEWLPDLGAVAAVDTHRVEASQRGNLTLGI